MNIQKIEKTTWKFLEKYFPKLILTAVVLAILYFSLHSYILELAK